MLQIRHLRMAARYAMHRLHPLHPFEVQAAVINACNLRCLYCRCPDEKIDLLDTAQWTDTISRLAALGTIRIKFQGGEPTLRHDFRELSATARRAGMITAVVTNGLQFAAQPELLDHLDEVVFSLDSIRPEHTDRVRGHGVHARVLDAIELVRSCRVRTFINMVVTGDTLDEIEPMLEFCEARGIGLNAQPVVFGRRYYDDQARSMALSEEQVLVMHRRLAEWKRQGRPLMFGASTYDAVRNWVGYDEISRLAPVSTCMAGRFYIHIEPNGDIHPCAQYAAGNFKPKNIVRDGLDAALEHVQRHQCGNCFSAYLNERKALFELRPHAVHELLARG